QIGLDEIDAEVDGEIVGANRVLRPVAGGAAMADDERRAAAQGWRERRHSLRGGAERGQGRAVKDFKREHSGEARPCGSPRSRNSHHGTKSGDACIEKISGDTAVTFRRPEADGGAARLLPFRSPASQGMMYFQCGRLCDDPGDARWPARLWTGRTKPQRP